MYDKKKDMKKQEMKKPMKGGDEATYKAMGGNVAGYYNKGGKVDGCGPSRNKPYSK